MKPGSPTTIEPVWSDKSAVGFVMEKADDAITPIYLFMLLINSTCVTFRQSASVYKWCRLLYVTGYRKPSVIWVGNPELTGLYQSLEMIERDYDGQQRLMNDVWTFKTQVSPLSTHGQSFFLTVKELQGQVLLHNQRKQGSRNRPTVSEHKEKVWDERQDHSVVQS